MRAGTTIAITVLLFMILFAGALQFFFLAR